MSTIINAVLNSTFNICLPPTFTKVNSSTKSANKKEEDSKHKQRSDGSNGKGGKKCKSEDGEEGKGNIVQNSSQPTEFKLTTGKSWKDNFANILPHDCPAWTDNIRMCMQWHIRGDCCNGCSRAISHITSDKIPEAKKWR